MLERCRERKYKLRWEKLRFKVPEVTYHGHRFTSDGLKPDPEKVKAVTDMPRPRDKAEVKRFLGMVNYLAKFLLNLSSVSTPLRELTLNDREFLWSKVHEDSLNQIKQMITNSPVFAYYNQDEPVELETDSSDYGLSAVLSQNGHPVHYASNFN